MELKPPHIDVAIIGTGFGGIGAALRLLDDGRDDFVLFERADAVGGVWRDNVYPGAACDVESHLYALGAAPHTEWSRRFSRQPEIQAYLAGVAESRGVLAHVCFQHDVERAVWDDDALVWRIETSRGDWTARAIVAAAGALAEPRFPDLPGLGTFAGTAMHTSRWDESVDLTGKRVAVVGTGASAIQVVPEIQPLVDHLTLFQRTPAHVIPRDDRALGGRLHGRPRLQRIARNVLYGRHEVFGLAFRNRRIGAAAQALLPRRHLRAQVADPDLRARLTPDYALGCKRILLSDDYYPALTQPNVTVTGAATRVVPTGVIDADGIVHAADVLVFATGFHVHDLPIAEHLVGRDGRTLAATWAGAPVAHLGTTVAGFPNLFILQGPNTGLGHSSVVLMMEAQIEHAAHALDAMDRLGAQAAEPTAQAQDAFAREIDRMGEGTVWTSGCQSWYLDESGRQAAVWPGSVGAFQRRVAPFDPAEYHLRSAHHAPVHAAPDPTLALTLRGIAARRLAGLPAAVAQRLAGAPDDKDGQRLDPHIQLLLRLNEAPDPIGHFLASPVRARHELRQDILSVDGPKARVGSVRDLSVSGAEGSLDARLYMPDARLGAAETPPLVVFFHGGGFVEGDLDTHDAPCRLLCRQAGHAVLSVAYRLAPEAPFPAAPRDAVAAFRWAQANAARLGVGRIAVGGDSAGANLAAVVAQLTRDDAPPAAQLLLYPATDTPTDRPSRHLFDGYLLPDGLRAAFFDVYTEGSGAEAADPRLSPGLATNLAGLAPAFVSTAGFDVLRDEAEAYAHALQEAGVPVQLFREADMPHGFLHLTSVSPAARRASVATFRRWRAFVAEQAG